MSATASAVVAYRTAVMAAIKTKIPEFLEVNWYDAVFDEDDVKGWTSLVPCCFVAVRDTSGEPHSTGEINLSLDMVVVIVTADVTDRDSDGQGWFLMEKTINLVNHNRFNVVDAAEPKDLKMARLRQPELRKMGVALSIVEWNAGLTIGTNSVLDEYYYRDPATGLLIEDAPAITGATTTIFHAPASTESVLFGMPAPGIIR